jgi:hypothetical protein
LHHSSPDSIAPGFFQEGGENMKHISWKILVLMIGVLLYPYSMHEVYAQGVTTGSINGTVRDPQGALIPGASVTAVHLPSGTSYDVLSLEDGHFLFPALRVGGPYKVTASLPGFNNEVANNLEVSLGGATKVDFKLTVASVTQEITVEAESNPVLSSEVTGAATAVTRDNLATLPSITGTFASVAKLTPQYSGTMNFAGQDNRFNNVTIDGSYFNNSFGLSGTLGGRTNVAPISLAAIEQVQIAVAPYDLRQGNFVGANVNSVTRSGDNDFRGSVYRSWKNQNWVGKTAQGLHVNAGTFNFANTGFWAAGPVVPNKVFVFGNYEDEAFQKPGTTFTANTGGQPVTGNVTRVLASDLDTLSAFLQKNFNYTTGPYQGYPFLTPAKRVLAKGDYNLNSSNKVSFRYTKLDSNTDVILSSSGSLGFTGGGRNNNSTALNFKNSNYQILENINSYVGHWSGFFGSKASNELIVAYDNHDESRPQHGALFPFVDILQANTVYTSFGYEPFTPFNALLYSQFQVQDNFTKLVNKHSLTFGATFEHYHSNNQFYPGLQSAYVYNSLADFYTDANSFLANPNRTTSGVALNHFQVRYSNLTGQKVPLQPLTVNYDGAFAQDQWKPAENLSITAGLRFDIPVFANTGYDNSAADQLTFMDEKGKPVQYNTGKLPDTNLLWSPRVGFNWNAIGNRNLQIRGGTGIFSGPPAYVWISNQIGNTGVLTGFNDQSNTTAFPFNPNPDAYKPAPTGGAPPSYELAVTDKNFKFPQLWRTSIGADHRMPLGFTGTADFIYNRDVNGIYYINANQVAPTHNFAGVDARPYWGTATSLGLAANQRIFQQVTDNTVLKNENIGNSWNLAFSAQRNISRFFVKAAYSYGQAKNTVDAGSIAFGSWSSNPVPFNGNTPPVAFSSNSPGHRFFVAASYRKEYFKFGATTVATIFEGNQTNPGSSNTSYVFSGDANGDGNGGNDLIYIPKDVSEMNFQPYQSGAVTFSAADQATAWDSYIKADHYLSQHRGQYAVRGATFLPMTWRDDLNFSQDFLFNAGGKRHGFQLRLDILNFTNALNHNWGVSQRLISTSPLTNPGIDTTTGKLTYRLRNFNNQLLGTSAATMPYQYNANLSDAYQVQVSIRFVFNSVGFLQ